MMPPPAFSLLFRLILLLLVSLSEAPESRADTSEETSGFQTWIEHLRFDTVVTEKIRIGGLVSTGDWDAVDALLDDESNGHNHHHFHRVGERDVSFCGTEIPDPVRVSASNAKVAEWKRVHGHESRKLLQNCNQCITIDTYFHVVGSKSSSIGNVPDFYVELQVDALNAGFADTPFRFELKEINRIRNDDYFSDLLSYEEIVKSSNRRGDSKTLNVYSGQLPLSDPTTILLGVATFPFDFDEHPNLDGILFNYEYYPGLVLSNNALGAAVVHEVGHWLGLFHVFGNYDVKECGTLGGDFVDDTPDMRVSDAFPHSGCPLGRDSCPLSPGNDPVTNFMDYRDEDCYEEFSPGQIERMYNHWMLYREQEEICQPSESLFELTIEPPLTHYWALYVVTDSGYELVLRSDEVQVYFPIPPNVIRTVNRCLVQGDYRFEFGPWYDPATYQVKLDGEVIAEANKTPVIASSRVFVATFSVFGEGMPVPGPPIPIPTPPTRTPISTPSPTPSPVSNDSDCVDVPAGWFDSTGDNCNWYAQDPLFCRNYGDSFENFGTTANKACCACGGGSSDCRDSPQGWFDSFGDDCSWYEVENRCDTFGLCCESFGRTANEACCVCGGGFSGGSTPTPAPTSAATPQVPLTCTDDPQGWYDADGPIFDCSFYGIGFCELFGDCCENFGKTANEACCVCGGGSRVAAPSTPPPTPQPTVPGTVCIDSPEGWYDSDGPPFDCAWYAIEDHCALYSSCCENFGRTASEACCACGGGVRRVPSPPPSPSPTRQPTRQPTASSTPPPVPSPTGFCFSSDNEVEVQGRGYVKMKDLVIGDMVRVMNDKFEPIYSFGHKSSGETTTMLQIMTEGVLKPLEISHDHMVMVEGTRRAIPASLIKAGDLLLTANGTLAPVLWTTQVLRTGIVAPAPFTESGSIFVNNILASNYISFQGSEHLVFGKLKTPFSYQWLAHAFAAPHRIAFRLGIGHEYYTESGISHWVDLPYKVATWSLKQNTWVLVAVLLPVLVVFGFFLLLESLVKSPVTLALVVMTWGGYTWLGRNKGGAIFLWNHGSAV